MAGDSTPKQIFLRGAGVLFFSAGLFHVWHVYAPTPDDSSGALRHTVFVGINFLVAACLWLRPSLLRLSFGLLVVQQVFSHGGTAIRLWSEQGRVDYLSIGVVVVILVTWMVLLRRDS